jgi:hypothetical protein
VNCTQIGCQYEVDGDVRWRQKAMSEHQATAHGIGSARAASHLGCPFPGCQFESAGSREFTAEATRLHLTDIHGVNPDKPETLPIRRHGR